MATEQVSPPKDMNRNPNGKGGFGEHPENRNPGGWKKEDTISYQYNRFLRMSDKELAAVQSEGSKLTQAMKIALKRIKEAENDLNTTKEITDRTEGKAPQYIGTGDPADAKKVMVEFIGYNPSDDIQAQDSNQ